MNPNFSLKPGLVQHSGQLSLDFGLRINRHGDTASFVISTPWAFVLSLAMTAITTVVSTTISILSFGGDYSITLAPAVAVVANAVGFF